MAVLIGIASRWQAEHNRGPLAAAVASSAPDPSERCRTAEITTSGEQWTGRSEPMARTRIHNFSISLDGFATAEGQRPTPPSATPANGCTSGCSPPLRCPHPGTSGRHRRPRQRGRRAARAGPRSRDHGRGQILPTVLAGQRRLERLVGPKPPFHTPTFVLTHRPRPSTYAARQPADGHDVHIGGARPSCVSFSPPACPTGQSLVSSGPFVGGRWRRCHL